MQFALEVHSLQGELVYLALPEEGLVTMGRDPSASLVLEDPLVSQWHLQLQLAPNGTFAVDAGSGNGFFVNGVRLNSALLMHGDAVRVGRTVVRLTALLDGKPVLEPLPPVPQPLPSWKAAILAELQQACAWAILDGAADPAIRLLLNATGAVYQSLYEGEPAIDVAPFGPFLVDLRGADRLLHELVQKGWDHSWGIFFQSDATLEDLRYHFRRQLTVQAEDGRRLLFRFYDPRVLRLFLPSCNPTEREDFFGAVQHFVVELPETGTLGMFQQRS